MLGPNDMKNHYDMDKVITDIDESMKGYHKWYSWEQAVIDYELPVEFRNEIAKKYIEAGWKYVYHITTSENNERAGLTAFKFSEKPVSSDDRSFVVMRSEVNQNEFVVYRNDTLLYTIN